MKINHLKSPVSILLILQCVVSIAGIGLMIYSILGVNWLRSVEIVNIAVAGTTTPLVQVPVERTVFVGLVSNKVEIEDVPGSVNAEFYNGVRRSAYMDGDCILVQVVTKLVFISLTIAAVIASGVVYATLSEMRKPSETKIEILPWLIATEVLSIVGFVLFVAVVIPKSDALSRTGAKYHISLCFWLCLAGILLQSVSMIFFYCAEKMIQPRLHDQTVSL
eukprot:158080_1